jgi:hypothetical protein
MRSFLWSGSDMRIIGAKVAWGQVCFSKRRGARNQKDNKMEQSCTWPWGKIFKLISLTRPKMKYTIGDGKKTSLWFDN